MRESGEPMEFGIFDFYKVFSRAFGEEEDGVGGCHLRPWIASQNLWHQEGDMDIPIRLCFIIFINRVCKCYTFLFFSILSKISPEKINTKPKS